MTEKNPKEPKHINNIMNKDINELLLSLIIATPLNENIMLIFNLKTNLFVCVYIYIFMCVYIKKNKKGLPKEIWYQAKLKVLILSEFPCAKFQSIAGSNVYQ